MRYQSQRLSTGYHLPCVVVEEPIQMVNSFFRIQCHSRLLQIINRTPITLYLEIIIYKDIALCYLLCSKITSLQTILQLIPTSSL